jgi:hypothetical protein
MFDDLLKFFAHLTVKKLFQCKDNYGHEFGIGAKLKFSGTPDSLTQFVENLTPSSKPSRLSHRGLRSIEQSVL